MTAVRAQDVPVPESISSIAGETLAAIHELNMRLRRTADRLSGIQPEPSSANQKSSSEPSVLDLQRFIRNGLEESHEVLGRIEKAI